MITLLWILLWVVIVGLMLVGLVGTIIPGIPGPILILAGAVIYAIVTGFTPIDGGRLGILAALMVATYVLGNPLLGLGAQSMRVGGWAVTGAILGCVVGFFFAPLGLGLGPLVGAMAGELVHTRELRRSLTGGLGALYGLLFSGVWTLPLVLTMIALFFWWVGRG